MARSKDRQKYILSVAKENGFVAISEAAKHLDVSIETVRRDITKLCSENVLKKVRGGASPIKLPIRKDADYLSRIRHNQHEKFTIGMEAARLIRDGSVVALDCGVSIQAIAHCVSGVQNVTFVTNSIPTASILLDKIATGEINGSVIMIGGEMDAKNKFSRGSSTTDLIDKYYFDISFISCTALSPKNVSLSGLDECSYSKHLIERSAMSVLIAESNKVGKNSVCSFAKISDFDKIIIDDKIQIPSDFEKEIQNTKAELIIVNCSNEK